MRTRALITMLALGCGGARKQSAAPPTKLLHSPELNGIMKSEVNQPFGFLLVLTKHLLEMHAVGVQERLGSANVPLAVPRPGYV